MNKRYPYNPDYKVPPGATLYEFLRDGPISFDDFKEASGINADDTIKLFFGDIVINSEIADKLEQGTKIPASFWKNAEKNYRENI